ncbi:hypothetical protein F5X99DRAFT_362152 [Biscogniauxia marginata]|nr:hypothetical protein F5X99DRAFT_362152 [Biscogniauxia marginata]
MQLPVEIVLLIFECLPNADAACVALTCKSLFSFVGVTDRMQLEPPAKEALLCRLGKEAIGVFYCHLNKSMLLFRRNGVSETFRRRLFGYLAEIKPYGEISFPGAYLVLPYYRARLVTNYRLFGPQHGIPPSSVSCRFPDVHPVVDE